MLLKYKLDNKIKSTSSDNEDIIFSINNEGAHMHACVQAKKDITLIAAKNVLPFFVNFKDVYFLNGYQSWTDTKEFKLSKRLRNVKKSPHLIVAKFGMKMYGDSTFYRYSIRRSHGYDVFYSKGRHECFLYNMNYKNAYLLIELIKGKKNLYLTSMLDDISLKAGESIDIFDYYFFDKFEEGLKSFNTSFPL